MRTTVEKIRNSQYKIRILQCSQFQNIIMDACVRSSACVLVPDVGPQGQNHVTFIYDIIES